MAGDSLEFDAEMLGNLNLVGPLMTPAHRRFLKKWCAELAIHFQQKKIELPSPASELTIALISTQKSQALNKQYRGKDYATDVLSFSDGMGLGDLVICLPVIRRQAKEHGLTIHEELGYMVLHGILHLLGYDHEKSDKEARRMYRLQDSIFADLTKPTKRTTAGKQRGTHGHRNRTQRR